MNTEIGGPPLMLRLIRTWRRRMSSFNLGETSGMPSGWARMTAHVVHRFQSTCAKERYERRIDRAGGRLGALRYRHHASCNDTRQTDGEPHELRNPVAAIALRRHYPCELHNLFPTRSESQPTLCLGRLPDDNSYAA